ncbi:MAG: histidine kinase dimerization/phospho-acceptor domain-containing protein [Bacteroidota bacterium]|jgi:PAS domain-containing protein
MSELCFKINKKGLVTECLSQPEYSGLSILVNKHLSEQNLPTEIIELITKYLHEKNYHCLKNVEADNQFYDLRFLTDFDECVCIINNITIRVKKYFEFDNNNNQFKALVDSTFDIIWSFDTNFILTAANQAFFDLRKKVFNSNIKIGDIIFKDVSESRVEKWKPIYEKVFAGNKLCFEDERIIGKKLDYVEINLNPVYNQNGIIVGCMGITRDINALKKKEIERKNYTQKLEEFAFKTSHELRRPLANILGFVPLLMEEKNSDQFTLLLEALNISAQQLDLEVKAMNETINKK